jgi:hypothetical protein
VNFEKISKSEVLLDLESWSNKKKALKESEDSRPTSYNRGRAGNNNYDSIPKHVNSIDSDSSCRAENWEKLFGSPTA